VSLRKRNSAHRVGPMQPEGAMALDPVARRNSRLALGLAVFAAAASLAGVTPGEAARAVKRALNADKVDGISASRTPRPNRLLALDSSARFPEGVLRGATRGPRGPEGPKGDAGQRGPSDILAAARDPAVNAGTAANTSVDVLTLTGVPPGEYWAIASTNVIYTGSGTNFFRCDVLVNGDPRGLNAVTGMGTAGGGSIGSWIIRQEPLSITVPSTVKLRCFHENALDSGDGRFERSRMSLIHASSVTMQAQP